MKSYIEYPLGYDESLANKVNNGCGPGNWKGKLIPNTIYGISIKEACKVHDYDFHIGGGAFEFLVANTRFKRNLKATCKHKATWRSRWLNGLRMIRCGTYYKAVKGGRKYFKEVKE